MVEKIFRERSSDGGWIALFCLSICLLSITRAWIVFLLSGMMFVVTGLSWLFGSGKYKLVGKLYKEKIIESKTKWIEVKE